MPLGVVSVVGRVGWVPAMIKVNNLGKDEIKALHGWVDAHKMPVKEQEPVGCACSIVESCKHHAHRQSVYAGSMPPATVERLLLLFEQSREYVGGGVLAEGRRLYAEMMSPKSNTEWGVWHSWCLDHFSSLLDASERTLVAETDAKASKKACAFLGREITEVMSKGPNDLYDDLKELRAAAQAFLDAAKRANDFNIPEWEALEELL